MEPINLRIAGEVDDTIELPVATARLPSRHRAARRGRAHGARARPLVHGEVVHRDRAMPLACSSSGRWLPGSRLRSSDLTRPAMVQKGASVLMLLDSPGIALTAQGQALEAGAIGERIRVLNPVSRAVVEAEVIGPDRVRVAPGAMPLSCRGPCDNGERAMNRKLCVVAPVAACLLLGGCGSLTSMSEVGRPPEMTPTSDPTKDPNWRPVTMPMPAREATPNEANALWRGGSRAFFKDQRAAQVGDIVTVLVNMTDTANVQNATTATRTSGETAGLANFFGMEALLPKTIADPSKLVTMNSSQQQWRHRADPAQ